MKGKENNNEISFFPLLVIKRGGFVFKNCWENEGVLMEAVICTDSYWNQYFNAMNGFFQLLCTDMNDISHAGV